jgi:hypothetical protein
MTRGAESDSPIEGQEFRKRKESAPIGREEILNEKVQSSPHRWRNNTVNYKTIPKEFKDYNMHM